MEIMKIHDLIHGKKPEGLNGVLDKWVTRVDGTPVYKIKGNREVQELFLNACGREYKVLYGLIDGFSFDANGPYEMPCEGFDDARIVPVEIKYRMSRSTNYQMNTRQLAVPGVVHLFYENNFTDKYEWDFEKLKDANHWQLANQLQFNPDVVGKTLREVLLEIHGDISRVEKRIIKVEKNK